MSVNKTVIATAAALVIMGGVCGFTLKGCITPSPPPVATEVRIDTVHYDLDSIRAEIRAEFRAELRPVVLRRTDTLLQEIPDSVSIAMAERAYAELDAVLARYDSLQDITATAYTRTDDYELSQAYSLRRREFAHSLNLFRRDTMRTELCPPPTFWDQVKDVGFWTGLGAIAYAIISLFAK